ncbi:MAG: DNA repair protein RadC [Candidatus Omnitrophica bacterium]|nr:DNA repair protein RadC [Candidatus Omnitrophota bacterium]
MKKNKASSAGSYRIKVRGLGQEGPREKLIKQGPDALKSAELLAIILNTGYRGQNVLELANRIIKEYGSKAITQEKNVGRLIENLGLPPVKACQIVACFELGRRFFAEEPGRLPAIRMPEDVFKYLDEMRRLRKEEFRGLYLNTRNKLIHDEVISIGTLTANLVHPREVFAPAIEYLAVGLIVAHNHPSGDPTPSKEDIRLTQRLTEAARIMGIDLLDHIIIGKNSFVSLKEQGVIPPDAGS